ncbi:type II toxin-antitoxin system PemK/MazF family toxin [Clostridium sp.]|jgi:mRNA interferase MazF|uniref:type II toxin-antitoxin system PemK/MazF family toxin n=1 Tax=Clostridium sp. TaxID=1506 RepID=UPI003FD795FF
MESSKEKIMIELEKTQKCLEWIKTMLFLDTNAEKATKRIVKRGQVYDCLLGIGIGSEESKKRPCVILQYDSANAKSPNTIVAPITHTKSNIPVVVPIEPKVNKDHEIILDGNVLLGNIVCVSKARLGEYKGNLNKDEMKNIDAAIGKSLDIKRHYDKLNNILNDKKDYIKKLKDKIAKLENQLNLQSEEISILEKIKHILKVSNTKDLPRKIEKILKDNMDNH